MVKVTIDLIARGTSGYTKKKREESVQHFIKRLTHLYLEGRGIDEVGDDIGLCRNLTVLYLYDNKLEAIPNLNQNSNLTHLYLQNNDIKRLHGVGHLKKLTKLYVGGNCITVIEGLENIDNLQELHAEHQKLPSGEQLLFDPRSLRALAFSLQVFNISGNNLNSIRDLECLREMQQFVCTDNKLYDMKEIAHVLGSWRHLSRLELSGNPLCNKSKYRDRIIVMSLSLESLDGKEINETSRQFLINWKASKEAYRQRKKLFNRHATMPLPQNGTGDHSDLLPPVQRRATASGYMMAGLPRKQFDEILAKSSSLPSSASPVKSGLYNEINAAPRNCDEDYIGDRVLNSYGTTMKDPFVQLKRMNLVNLGGKNLASGESAD
ncbi:protein phosphatase 1 regulatory subunit 42-like isoform X2 [Tubulanus polymorphus]|uniref:protein phosphatase 1 regulatory subunit 42-like isoform X2 n=1 Tax=Tubulanus polymorphus TaxID=672921 RepID=UPI003DA6ABB3